MLDKINSNTYWCELAQITPETANTLLRTNVLNRDISKSLVKKMSTDMATGKWKLNGESIKFDNKGRLVDGQHRLHAIAQAKVTIKTFACGGLDPKIFDTLDVGKQRNLGDVMKLAGVPHYHKAAAATKWLVRLNADDPLKTRSTNMKPADYLAFYETVEHDLQEAIKAWNRIGGKSAPIIACPPALAIGLYYKFRAIDEQEAESFFHYWNAASERPDLATSSPPAILADQLSERMARLARIGGRFHDSDRLLMIVTTWNAWIRNEKLKPTDLAKISVQNTAKRPTWPGILTPPVKTEEDE